MAINFIRDIISSGYNLTKINGNFAKIEAALSDGLSRSGNGPNELNSDLDMNGNNILNIKSFSASDIKIQGEDLSDKLQSVVDATSSAILSAQEAANYASNAEDSANIAYGFASDIVSQGNVPIYSSALGVASLTIPDGITAFRTNGYSSANGKGAALYRLKGGAETTIAGDITTNSGSKRWELSERVVSPEMFGAVGNGSLTDASVGANDVQAFVLAARYSKAVGGVKILLSRGAVYRIAYNSTYPAIILPSNTTLDFGDSAYMMLDTSTLPVASVYPSALGCITTGNPDTGYRCGANASAIAGTGNLVSSGWDPTVDMVDNLHIINPRIRCLFDSTLSANQRLNGIKLWFPYNSSIIGADVRGTPNSGVAVYGGSNVRVSNVYAEDCGFGAATGTDRNGVSLFGYMITDLAHPEYDKYSSKSWQVNNISSHNNFHEGMSFAGVKGFTLNGLIGYGNLDRLLEGDTSFDNSETSATRSQEIPGEYVLTNVIGDGRYTGTRSGFVGEKSDGGISIGCDNETRVTLSNVRLREFDTTDSVPVCSVFCNSGGRVSIDNITLENIVTASNQHLISTTMQYVSIKNVNVIGCSAAGTSYNSAIVQTTDPISVDIDGVSTDASSAMVYGFRIDGSVETSLVNIRNFNILNLRRSLLRINKSGNAKLIIMRDGVCKNICNDGTSTNALVQLSNTAFTCDLIDIQRVRARFGAKIEHAIREDSTLANGAIALVFMNNDIDPVNMVCPNTGLRSYNRSSLFTDVHDYNNGFPSQKLSNLYSTPSYGTWGKGDRVVIREPSAGGTSEQRCTQGGTYGTLASVTATTTSGSANIVVNSAGSITLNQFVTIAGVTGVKRVIGISGTTITLDTVCDASVSSANVSYSAPVWKSLTLSI